MVRPSAGVAEWHPKRRGEEGDKHQVFHPISSRMRRVSRRDRFLMSWNVGNRAASALARSRIAYRQGRR
jgi:DNA-binding cell septation regulator SpoVG